MSCGKVIFAWVDKPERATHVWSLVSMPKAQIGLVGLHLREAAPGKPKSVTPTVSRLCNQTAHFLPSRWREICQHRKFRPVWSLIGVLLRYLSAMSIFAFLSVLTTISALAIEGEERRFCATLSSYVSKTRRSVKKIMKMSIVQRNQTRLTQTVDGDSIGNDHVLDCK